MDDMNSAEVIAVAGQEYAEEEFSINYTASNVLDVYKELLKVGE